MPVPKSDMPSRSKRWPLVLSPPPDKPSMPPLNISNKPEPIVPSIHFYSAKPFGMSATTMQWSTCETTSIASYRQGDDHRHQTRPAQILQLPTWPTFWLGSTTHPCTTCITNRSFKTEETMMGTMSEVAVFTP